MHRKTSEWDFPDCQPSAHGGIGCALAQAAGKPARQGATFRQNGNEGVMAPKPSAEKDFSGDRVGWRTGALSSKRRSEEENPMWVSGEKVRMYFGSVAHPRRCRFNLIPPLNASKEGSNPMSRLLVPFSMIATASFAAVPVQFTAGTKASADDVNRNFAYVDSAKASKGAVDLMTATVNGNTMATSALATRHDSLVGAVKTHVDSAKLSKGLGAKADTAALTVLRGTIPTTANLGAKADTTWVNGKLQGKADSSISRILRDTALAIRRAEAGYIDSAKLEGRLSQPITVTSSAYTRWMTTAAANDFFRISSFYNGVFLSKNVYWADTWKIDNPAGVGLMYIQHQGNSRHEFRVWPTGDPNSWLIPLSISAQAVSLTVPLNADSIYTRALAYKVSTPVADYVFEPDYRLAPLSEIDAYVRENKHLPEVPSASEMESNGVDLAKMNMLLLKKVEELTLHAIEQEKRIQALERKSGN